MSSVQENIANEQRYDGVYIGRVVAVDTTGQGRVKVTIPGLLEGDDLPWIGFERSSPFGQGPGFGVFGTPAIGSGLNIEFQNGDLNFGYISGGFVLGEDAPPEFRNPHVWGYRDPSGTQLVVNTETKDYIFTHASGNVVHVNAAGDTQVTDNGGRTVTVGKDLVVNVTGKADITAAEAHVRAPDTTCHGNLSVLGILSALNGFRFAGGATGTATMTGNVNHSGGEIRSNGVTISKHTHPLNADDTAQPTPGT